MKIQIRTFLLGLGMVATMLTACNDKEYIVILGPDGKPLEHPGRIIVDPDDLPPGSDDKPVITDEGGNSFTITPGIPTDVEEGDYQLIIVTPSDGLDTDGSIVSIAPKEGNELPQAPDFEADSQTITVERDKTTEVEINLKPMTREVHFKTSITGADVAAISSVEIALYGVARRVDVSKGFGAVLPEPSGTEYFTTAVQSPYVPDGIIPMRLLGMLSERPHAKVGVIVDGNLYTIIPDALEGLEQFNTGNPDEPVVLQVDLEIDLDDPEGAKVTGTIKPWDKGKEVEIEAD